MYCDGCGTTIHAGMQYCQRCGKRIIGAAGAPAVQPAAQQGGYATGRVQRNIQLLGGLWLVYGALRLVSLAWLVIFGRMILPSIFDAIGRGGADNVSWSVRGLDWGSWFWPFGLWFGGVSIVVFGVAYLVLGWALHARKPWARMFGLVLGFLVLLRIPFGTALGIYTIWVLMPESSRVEYDAMARP